MWWPVIFILALGRWRQRREDQFLGLCQLPSELETSLDYARCSLKTNKAFKMAGRAKAFVTQLNPQDLQAGRKEPNSLL